MSSVKNETLTLTLSKSSAGGIVTLSESLLERMHVLLERNNEGELSTVEQEQLETLVQMAHFGQMVSAAIGMKANP